MENKTSFLIKDILDESHSSELGIQLKLTKEELENESVPSKLTVLNNTLNGEFNLNANNSRKTIEDFAHDQRCKCVLPQPTVSAEQCADPIREEKNLRELAKSEESIFEETSLREDVNLQEISHNDYLKTSNDKPMSPGTSCQCIVNQGIRRERTPFQTAVDETSDPFTVNQEYEKDCKTIQSFSHKRLSQGSTSEYPDYQQKIALRPYTTMSQHVQSVTQQHNTMRHLQQRIIHHSHLPTKTRKRDKKVRRPRTNFTDDQLRELESLFLKQKYLNVQERMELADRLGLNEIQVKTWYQNRRTKWKRQNQMKVEYFGQTIHTNPYHQHLPDSGPCAVSPVKPNPVHLADILGGQHAALQGVSRATVAMAHQQHHQKLVAHAHLPGGGYVYASSDVPRTTLQEALAFGCVSYY